MITGLHHVSMKTVGEDGFERVKSFYGGVLGFPVIKECKSCVLFDTGAGIIEIFRGGEAADTGVIRHFALSADDTDLYAEMVRKAGYEVTVEPKDILVGGDEAFPARVAFCIGPLGEQIEFFCQRW